MKKRSLLLLLVIALPFFSIAQQGGRGPYNNRGDRGGYQKPEPSSLSVFSTSGEMFFLVLNGVNQNNTPSSRIRVEGLPQYGTDIQILFADNVTPAIRKKVNIADPVDGQAVNMTLKIERARDGRPRLKFFKCREVEQNYRPEQGEYVMNYGNPTQITTYTTTTTINNDQYGQREVVQTTYDRGRDNHVPPPPPVIYPMDDKSFSDALKAIKSASFYETKMSTAKTIFGVNYITTEQARQVAREFGFDEDKLAFVKFAYKRVTDQANYYKLASVFSFDDSKQQLNEFITANQQR